LLLVLAIGGPSAAVVIESLRQRQGQLLTERTNLIDRMGQERSELVDEKAAIRKELNIWEGQANPWELWPPKSSEPPQRSLLRELLSKGQSLALQWQANLDKEQQAFGHLALAMMYDELSQPLQATSEYSAARAVLQELSVKNPSDSRSALALADCCTHLSRLIIDQDRDRAETLLREAEQALERVGASHQAISRAELLITKLDLAILPGYAKAADSLKEAEQLKNSFAKVAPSNPQQLYQLTCLLTNRTSYLELAGPEVNDSPEAEQDLVPVKNKDAQ
jgi:hypothetical protein